MQTDHHHQISNLQPNAYHTVNIGPVDPAITG